MDSFLPSLLLVLLPICFAQDTIHARVVLSGKSGVSGTLNLTDTGAGVKIVGLITGLTPGHHGFHVHQYGDVFTNGCDSTGGHFNPRKVLHGSPDDKEDSRHVGDLGNVLADAKGVADFELLDDIVSLGGENSILGRAFVVHAGEDDLGKGGNEGSTKTGNAGGRVACGIVAIVA